MLPVMGYTVEGWTAGSHASYNTCSHEGPLDSSVSWLPWVLQGWLHILGQVRGGPWVFPKDSRILLYSDFLPQSLLGVFFNFFLVSQVTVREFFLGD